MRLYCESLESQERQLNQKKPSKFARTSAPARVPQSSDDRMVDAFSLLVRWARRELHVETVKEAGFDIDPSAAVIIGKLYFHEPVRMSDLAEHLGLDRSTVSRQVAAVIKKGYVTRRGDVTDARAAMLSLTPRGHAVRKKLGNAFKEVCLGLLSDWKREDRQTFARLIDKLADRFRGEGVY